MDSKQESNKVYFQLGIWKPTSSDWNYRLEATGKEVSHEKKKEVVKSVSIGIFYIVGFWKDNPNCLSH